MLPIFGVANAETRKVTSPQIEQAETAQANLATQQRIMQRISLAHVSSVNIAFDTVRLVVINPPSGRPKIMLNGKDITQWVQSESRTEAGRFSTIAYVVAGPPKDLHLLVGSNTANISYSTQAPVEFNFICTESQYHQAELRSRSQHGSR